MAARRSKPQPDLVGAAADELYGRPLEEFTSARNELAKRVRADDPEAAAAIAKLAKPNTVGWLANQLVRAHPDEIAPLLELGASMREATASLDAAQLRELSRQQRQVVHALVQQARKLAARAGRDVADTVTRGLEDTLHAALADAAAAEQLQAGRLTSGLSRSGFPGLDDVAAQPTASRRAASKPAKRPVRRATADATQRQKLQQAKRDEADARRAAQGAARERDQAQRALDGTKRAVSDAATEVDRLKSVLDAALIAQTEAKRDQRHAREELARADGAARRADRALQNAIARRQQLEC